MKKLALAAALALASLLSSPARAVTATVTGYVGVTNGTDPRLAQTFSTPAGETGQINVVVKNANGSAYDLTGAQQLLLTVRDRNNAVIISHQATINSPSTAGTAFFPLVVADTVGLSAFGDVGYSYDVWVTDASGNRWAAVKTSIFSVTRAQGQPAQPVTVPATQTPLAQGPPGIGQMQSPPGSLLTQRAFVTVDGTLLVATDNPGSLRTDITAPGLVAKTRNVATSGPLTGGGTLAGDLTLACASCINSGTTYSDPNWLTTLAGTKIAGAVSNATTAVNFSGALAGDTTGSQGATSVVKIQGTSVSASGPTANQLFSLVSGVWTPIDFYPTVTGETGVTNKLYPVADGRRYGATGDSNGTSGNGTDNRTLINNAITSAAAIASANTNAGNAVVQLPCGRFRVGQDSGSTTDYAIQGASNVTLQGQGACTIIFGDVATGGNYTHHILIGAAGTYSDFPALGNPPQNYPSTRIGTNTIALGATTITANPTGGFSTVVAGDWIEVTEGPSPKWDTKVERVRVLSVSGDTITLTAPIDIAFDNSSGTGVGIFRWNPVQNFWIKNLTITGTPQTYGPSFQETEGGGLENVIVDSTGWVNPFWYANDTDQWTMRNCVVKTGLFGGFNRASHGLVDNTLFASVGALSVEAGQGGIYNHWHNNQFIGATLPTGNGALIGGGTTWFETWDYNAMSADSTINGILQVKGATGFRFSHNTISVGGTQSYIFNIGSSDGTNTGVATTGSSFNDNAFNFDGGAGAPPLGGVIYLAGNPQCVGCIVRGNRLVAPVAVTPFIKIANTTTTATLDIYDNTQNNGTSFTHTFANTLSAGALQSPSLDAPTNNTTLTIGGSNANQLTLMTSGTARLNLDTSSDLSPNVDNTGGLGLNSKRFTNLYAFNLLAGNAAAADTAGTALLITGQAAGAASAATGKVGGPITITPGRGSAGNNAGGFNGGTGAALNINGAQGGDGGAAIAPGAGGSIVDTTGAPGSQNGGSGNGNSGNRIFNIPAPVGAGSYGQYQLQFGGANHLTLNQTGTLQYALQTGNKIFNITGAAVDTAGVSWTIQGQQGGTASATGGGAGGALTDAAGQGGTATAALAAGNGGTHTGGGGVGGSGVSAINPGNGGDAVWAGGAAGAGGGGNANGGNGRLRGGAKSGTGTAGNVFVGDTNTTNIQVGSNGGATISPLGAVAVPFPFTVGGNIASSATISPAAPLVHITGTTTINTITVPTSFAQTATGGCIRLIPDGLWATGTSGNIAIASTAVVSKALEECWDNGTSKWYPSY